MTPDVGRDLMQELEALAPLPMTGSQPLEGTPDGPTAVDVQRHLRHRVVAQGNAIRALIVDATGTEKRTDDRLWWFERLLGLSVGVQVGMAGVIFVETLALAWVLW